MYYEPEHDLKVRAVELAVSWTRTDYDFHKFKDAVNHYLKNANRWHSGSEVERRHQNAENIFDIAEQLLRKVESDKLKGVLNLIALDTPSNKATVDTTDEDNTSLHLPTHSNLIDMDNKTINTPQFAAITLMLTPEAINWLGGITCGVPHLTIYKDLLFGMAVEDETTRKRGIDVPLRPLEVEASANGLAEKWNMSRKVMIRLLNDMQRLGLIKLTSSKLTSIATMSAVTDYLPIEKPVVNPSADESVAEQQSVAQTTSGTDVDDIPSAFAEDLSSETPSASAVAAEVSDDTSAKAESGTSTDTSKTPHGQPHNPAVNTLFDGMEA